MITVSCAVAYVADRLIPYNCIFLISSDGTPCEIVYDLTGGSPILYPLSVVLLFILHITAFYLVCFPATRKKYKVR